MNISELSIRRPVLSTVLTIIILLFGFIGYSYLGVREFPSVDNPIISVTCSYPGANADVIENQITEPLEQNINGIPGIRSMSSVSSQGQSRITVEFELSVDLETAANDVRDKVSRAQRYLPRDCDPPTVTKADADATPILMVTIQSDKRSLLELSEIADLTVKEQLQTISDVSGVQIWGEKRYSMRLWLDPAKMAGYGITPTDIKTALDRENVELPSGSIEGNTTELTIRTIDLAQITGTETFEVTPELPSGVTSRADSQTVKITVTLKGLVTKEFTVPTANILRKEAPAGMTFADQNVKITVRGRASVMSTLRMEDLTVTADFSRHYDAAAKQVELEVALPANVSAGVIGGPYTVQVSLSETDGGNTES